MNQTTTRTVMGNLIGVDEEDEQTDQLKQKSEFEQIKEYYQS